MWIILFFFGAAVGSFLNVLALRYNPERFLLGRHAIGGRSHCSFCHKTLRWYELVPLLSFVIQAGRCRSCKAKLDFQYPASELIAGFIVVWTPMVVRSYLAFVPEANVWVVSTIWVLVFWTFLLLALIDFRLHIIPDELNIFLIILGLAVLLVSPSLPLGNTSFMGAYSLMFGLGNSIWINHLLGALFGLVFVGALIAITRGRGMGIGDLKLAIILGLIFGWPDIVMILFLAFIIGSLAAFGLMAFSKQHMKSEIAFGPYLALASILVFGFGEKILAGYFSLFGII